MKASTPTCSRPCSSLQKILNQENTENPKYRQYSSIPGVQQPEPLCQGDSLGLELFGGLGDVLPEEDIPGGDPLVVADLSGAERALAVIEDRH